MLNVPVMPSVPVMMATGTGAVLNLCLARSMGQYAEREKVIFGIAGAALGFLSLTYGLFAVGLTIGVGLGFYLTYRSAHTYSDHCFRVWNTSIGPLQAASLFTVTSIFIAILCNGVHSGFSK